MPTVPSIDEIVRAILDASRAYNPRPGTIIPRMGVATKLMPGRYTADEVNRGFAKMLADEWIELAGPTFFKLTDVGFAAL